MCVSFLEKVEILVFFDGFVFGDRIIFDVFFGKYFLVIIWNYLGIIVFKAMFVMFEFKISFVYDL